MDEMKTTPPRTLVQYMNTHLNRFRKKYDEVQKVIDALPESRDATAEIADGDQKSKTLSDNQSENKEEVKNEESAFYYENPLIKIDYDAIATKQVEKTSKAGSMKASPEPKSQEIPEAAMITPMIPIKKEPVDDDHLLKTPELGDQMKPSND